MSEPIQRVLNALLHDLQAGVPIRLDDAERYRAELDGYIIQFEGEDDLLHCSVIRADGTTVDLEAAHAIVEPFFGVMPKGIVWFKPAERSVHYYVGHDHFLAAHQQANNRNMAPRSEQLPSAKCMQVSDTEHALIQAARTARAFAYAPYSNYAVGAAVLTDDQRIVSGCNVENASYGLSLCAERIAVFNAVVSGARRILAAAVCTPDGGTPCGACRQVLLEFAPDPENCAIWVVKPDEIVRRYTLAELLPHGFRLR